MGAAGAHLAVQRVHLVGIQPVEEQHSVHRPLPHRPPNRLQLLRRARGGGEGEWRAGSGSSSGGGPSHALLPCSGKLQRLNRGTLRSSPAASGAATLHQCTLKSKPHQAANPGPPRTASDTLSWSSSEGVSMQCSVKPLARRLRGGVGGRGGGSTSAAALASARLPNSRARLTGRLLCGPSPALQQTSGQVGEPSAPLPSG